MVEARRSQETASRIEQAFVSGDRVSTYTHNLYRYPARFSPQIARAAIEAFTDEGELVLDPFVGGGTSAVEAFALRRRFLGSDINSLAVLVARAKTQLLRDGEFGVLEDWLQSAKRAEGIPVDGMEGDPRLGNAPAHLVEALAPFVRGAAAIEDSRTQDAARLILLDVGQWAVDGRDAELDIEAIRSALRGSLSRLRSGLVELEASSGGTADAPELVLGPAQTVMDQATGTTGGRVALVLTSPPYPGVHVLYHRWQVRGRRETGLPYWLSDTRDGAGPSFYMMGSRNTILGELNYFTTAATIWRGVRELLRPGGMVVQVIAFADADRQLPKYLDVMATAGFVRRADLEPSDWRNVPNRRWYNRIKPDRATGRELLLVHEADSGGPSA